MLSPITGKPFYTPGRRKTAHTNVELKAYSAVELYTARMYAIFCSYYARLKTTSSGQQESACGLQIEGALSLCVAEKHGALRVQHQQVTLFLLSPFLPFSYFSSYLLPFPSSLCLPLISFLSLPCRQLTSAFLFRRVCIVAKSACKLRHVRPPAYISTSPIDGFTLHMIRKFYENLSNSKSA